MKALPCRSDDGLVTLGTAAVKVLVSRLQSPITSNDKVLFYQMVSPLTPSCLYQSLYGPRNIMPHGTDIVYMSDHIRVKT